MLYQIWKNDFEGTISLCVKGDFTSRTERLQAIGFNLGLLEDCTELVAEYEASNDFDAASKRNKIMGWEPYK